MRPKIHLPIAVTTLILTMSAMSYAQSSELEALAPELASRIAERGGTTVAVADFSDLQGRVTELGRYLAEELSIALVNTDAGLRIIDRGHIRSLLAEHELAEQGIIDQESASELGRIAGVDVLIAGTVSERDDGIRLNIKALDTNTAAIIAGKSVTLSQSSEMSGLMRRDVASDRTPGASQRTSMPPDVRAFQNDFLVVTVDSVAVSEDASRATLALTIENKSSTVQGIGCGDPGLVDDRAGDWRNARMTGIRWVDMQILALSSRYVAYTDIGAGSKTAATIAFRNQTRGAERPSHVSFSVACVRRSGRQAQQFTIGITRIPVP